MSNKLVNQISLVITLLWVVTSFSCRKQCENANFAFEGTAKALQQRNIFKVGDTLWLSFEFNKCGVELIRNQTTCVEDLRRVGIMLDFDSYDSASMSNNNSTTLNYRHALNDFTFIFQLGELGRESSSSFHRTRTREFLFAEKADKFVLTVGVICKSKGFFHIGNSHVHAVTEQMTCRVTTVNFPTIWPTNQLSEMLGVNNWQTVIAVMPKHWYYFKVT